MSVVLKLILTEIKIHLNEEKYETPCTHIFIVYMYNVLQKKIHRFSCTLQK